MCYVYYVLIIKIIIIIIKPKRTSKNMSTERGLYIIIHNGRYPTTKYTIE
jgi:hypothetical protein